MKKLSINPVLRAVGVIGVVAALVTGVTFAAFNSQATLSDNTLTSTTADLVINSNPPDTTFAASEPGFDFGPLDPGTPSDNFAFQLRNQGTTTLNVNVKITSADPVTFPAGITANDVSFTFTPTSPSGTAKTFTWAQLTTANGQQLLQNFAANATGSQDYTVSAKLANTVTGSGDLDVGVFDFVFSGTAVPAPSV